MDKHLASIHEDSEKSHKCDYCDASYENIKYLKRHMGLVHKVRNNFVEKCEKCDYSTHRPENMRRHISAVHEGKKPYQCENCDKSFKEKRSLENHIINSHEESVQLSEIKAVSVKMNLY